VLSLNLVVSGQGHYLLGARRYALSPGTALFIAPGVEHQLEETSADFELWMLAPEPAPSEQEGDEAASVDFLRAVSAGDCIRLLAEDDARWLAHELRRLAATRSPALLRAGLAYVMTGAQEAFARGPAGTREERLSAKVRRCMALLEEQPALSRTALARRARAAPDVLSHAFKRELGVSLVAYRNRLRVRRFLELAASGRLTLRAACLQAGFGSYPQFHRVFVAETGQTPRAHLAANRRPPRPASAAPLGGASSGLRIDLDSSFHRRR
jgi:AraC-like DNA-binding protein